MDTELDLLLGAVIDSLTKLHLLLSLQDDPRATRSPQQIAAATNRNPDTVARALAELAEAGLVQRFPVGRGRIVLYSVSEDAHVRALTELLRTRFTESDASRAAITRKLTERRT